MRVADLVGPIQDHDLIGVNIHWRPDENAWVVWTRKRNSDGWSISGHHAGLDVALKTALGMATMSEEEESAIEDLI